MRLICEHSDYPFTSARWTLPPAKFIDSADISCDESFETECSIAGGSSCDNEDISCGYLGEPEYTEPINQLNLVLRAAVVKVTS